MNIKVRNTTELDCSILTNLIRESYRDVANKFNLTENNAPTHPSNCKEDWIKKAFEKGIKFYILELNHIPIGCVALEFVNSNLSYLERLAVIPQYRRKGYGKILVHHALKEVEINNLSRIEIGIIAADLKLKRWYKELGFQEKSTISFNHLPFEVTFMFIEL